jgi:hypothetical protein
MKLRRIPLEGNLECVAELRNVYKVLVEKAENK